MPVNIRSFDIVLTNSEYHMVKRNDATRLYQTKVVEAQKNNRVNTRFFTNRPDSLLRDMGKVLGYSKAELQTKFGMETDEQRAAREAALVRKKKMAEVRKAIRNLAASNGYRVENLI